MDALLGGSKGDLLHAPARMLASFFSLAASRKSTS
jgi:hypothetical protein